jgi:host factor-I protein
MEQNLLDRMLDQYQKEQAPVTLTLQNKIRVHGKIKAFDSYVILMENQKNEILYRHAVSSLSLSVQEEIRLPSPSRPVQAKPSPRPAKPSPRKPREIPQTPKMAAAGGDSGLNSGMKEGLLKWMQTQKVNK